MKVFISYTVRDGNINEEVLKKIESIFKSKYEVFIDLLHNDSEVKDKQERVIRELISSDVLFLIKTKSVMKSEWVKKEIEIAEKNNIAIKVFKYEYIFKNKFYL